MHFVSFIPVGHVSDTGFSSSQASDSSSNHEGSGVVHPQQEVQSTQHAREQLSNIISHTSDSSHPRNCQSAQGKKVHL